MNTTTWIILLAMPFLITFAAGGISAAPWVPTLKRERDLILKHLPLIPGSVVYDIGCGDAVVLFAAVQKEPAIKAIGYEISLLPYLIAKWRARKYPNVHIGFKNFFKAPLGDADIVFSFLLPKCYPRLIKKLGRELKPDALVVVEAWPFPGIEPHQVIREEKILPVYLYTGAQLKNYA